MINHEASNVQSGCISEKNFIKANEIAISKSTKHLEKGKVVVFDGCFYHKSQIEYLIKNMPFNSFVFTLKATLDECISRDKKRSIRARIGEKNVREVYNLVSRFESGVAIDTTKKTPEEIMTEIISRLPENFSKFDAK